MLDLLLKHINIDWMFILILCFTHRLTQNLSLFHVLALRLRIGKKWPIYAVEVIKHDPDQTINETKETKMTQAKQ